MCRLQGKFAPYLRRVLYKTRLIFPRINGPNIYVNNIETKRSYKRTVNLKNLNFFKKLLANVNQNVYKTANKRTSIHTNQILVSSNRLDLSGLYVDTRFQKRLKLI